MKSKFLGVDAVHFDQHEIATVEGVDLPALRITWLVGDLEDMFGADPQCFAFRVALRSERRRCERTLDQGLR